jgi:hypothetical protein
MTQKSFTPKYLAETQILLAGGDVRKEKKKKGELRVPGTGLV